MGAICSLEQNEKLANSLGTYLHIKMQESVEGGKPFKLSTVMKEVYDISYKKNKDDVKSLGIAGAIPSLFFDIQMKKPILFNSILKSGTDINAIVTLSGEINSSDDPTKVVAEFIEKGGIAGISELIANDVNNTVTEKKVTKLTPTKGPILDLKLLMPTLTSSTGVSQVTRNGANVIFESDPLKRASYNALQNIVAALEKSDVSSYESLEYDNHVGFKLRAVVEKNLPSPEKNIYDEDKASNATVVAITDVDGNYLYFDDNGRIVPEESGKIAYFRLRKLEDKDAIIEAGKNALARLYKVGKDQIPEEDVRFLVNQIEKEATELSNIKKDATDPNKKVMLDIVDGKVGFIDKNQYQENKSLSKFTKTPTEINTIGELRNFTKTTKGGGSYEVTLPSITFDNGITVELMGYKIKKTTPELFNNLINLLVDDLVRPDGTVVKPSEKIALFKQFFFPLGEDSTPKENKLRMFEKNDQLVMSIGNDIINTDNKEEARKKLEEFLDLSGYHSYIKRPGVSYISFNIENGILYTEEKNYNDFIFDNVYPNIVLDINTGRPMVSNGYFNFSRAIDQEQLNAFTKSSTDKANKITKKLKIDDWSADDLLERSKAIEDRFTPEQLRRADAWAAATPLFKIQVDGKPVITLQDALNIVNSDAFATFANATITMYKGANSTHLYHEAWHAFSQIFLKKAERTKLYKAAATLDTKFTYVKKSGTGGGQFQEVVTVNLNTLDPNNKQDRKILEEFIAEEYRIYAMNGGKFLVEDEKANIFKKIFNKIWALLKGLFTGESLTSVYSNPGSAPIFNEMFSALYNAKTEEDLIMFQPSIKNAEFGTLNSGSIKDEDGNIALNDIQSQLISKSIDGLIGQISNQLTMDRSIYGANLVIFSNKKALTKLYNQTIKQALVDRLNEMVAEYEANSDMYTDIENDYHINNIDTLTKALENYGDITNILNNTSDKESVIAYHIKNSAFKDKILSAAKDPTDIGDTNVLEVLARNDKSSNEFKAEEIASQNAIYLIESLLQEEYQDNKRSRIYKVNKLGLPQVIDFQPFWNFLLNKVSGVKNETELYNALVELSNKKILPEVEQLVERLGQPEKMLTSRKAARMWLGMIRSLNLAPINLVNNVFEETIVEKESSTGEIFKFATLDVTSGKIVADYTNIKNNVWNNRFNIDVSPYIFVNNDKQNQLDLNKIIDRFITKYIDSNNVVKYKLNDTIKPGQEVIKSNDPIEFLNAIGLYMSDTIDIRANLDFYGINQLANAIGQANFNQLPVTNPVSFFSQSKNLNYQRSENGVISTANNKLKVESNATIVNNLATLEAQYSTSYGSQMIPLPSGDGVKSRFSMNSSTSKIEHAINSVSNVKELDDLNNENGYVPTYSKERNPAVMGSIYRKSLFDSTTGEKVKDNSLILEELVGSQYKNATGATEGLSHDQMNENDKFLSDLIGYLTAGNIEAVRSGEKSTYLSLKVAKIVTDALYDKKSNHLFFDTEDFVKDQYGNYITKNNINRIIKDVMFTKLEGELRRIKKLNEGISPEQAQALGLNPEDAKDFYKKNVKGFSNINMLDWFDEILDSKEFGNELKEDLINNYSKMLNDTNNLNSLLLSTDEGKELKTQIEKQIFDYFNTLANEFKTQNYIPLFGNKVPDFLMKLATKKLTELQKREVTPEQAIDALMMSFAVNTALHSDEIITLVFGDGLQFNHKKAESTKRVPTYNSPGITFSTGNLSVAAISTFYSRGYEQKLIDQGIITDRKEPRTFSKIGQKAVIKDPVVATARYEQYNDMFYNVLIKRNYTEDQVKELLYGTGNFNNPGKDSIMHTWKNISKADGQGYITLDYYRMLKANEDKWTEKQEELYQKIINDEYVPAGDIEDIFPVYKLLHAGPLSLPEGMYPIESIDKFSLLPLIPSLIKDKNLDVIHKEMIKQGVDYIVFDSGAKRSYIKSGETNGDDIFEGNDTRKLKPNFKFTKNPFHVEYLRNVTEVNNFFKGKSTFATQFRKLFDVTLYEKGVPVDFKGTKAEWDALSETEKQKSEVYRTTEAALNSALRLQDYLKLELYEEFGYDIEDGKPVMSDQTKIDMIDYLKKKLLEQGYTEHELEAFDTEGPDFEVDLSTSPVAARLEKFMFSIINNKLVRLKVNGEPLVQVSNSFFHKFTKPTEEETKKYDDFEENAGYIVDPLGKQKTIGVKVKIALTENYENLYKTKYFVKNKEGEWEAKGTVGVYDKVYDENKNFIGKKLNHEKSFGRLNEMLRVDAWLKSDNNAKKIQLTGVRIPVQGGNSAEFAQVWEFLPPASGTIIIIPAEIVAKSGGDFDVDKLTMYLKYITKQGTLIEDTYKDPKEITAKIAQLKQKIKDLKETKKQLKDVEDLFILDSLADFRSAIRKTFGRLPFTDEQKEALVNKDDKTLLETLNKKAIKKLLERFSKRSKPAYKIFKTQIEKFDVSKFDEVKATIDNLDEKSAELNNLYNQISDLYEHKRNFASGIQNTFIDNIIKTLELPQMAFSLLLPNGTYLAKPFADDLEGIIRDLDGQRDYKKSLITGKDRGTESPSVLRNYNYNLKKQQDNKAGKSILGPIVLEIPANNLLNKAGAMLNPYVIEEVTVGNKVVSLTTPITLELKHNYTIEKVKVKDAIREIRRISMSELLDADKTNQIADVLSQLTNGAVDVGKDAWIAFLQGNLVAIPKILFLLEAGVPIGDVAYFMNNPYIRKFIKVEQKAKSKLAKVFYGVNHKPYKVIGDYVSNIVDDVIKRTNPDGWFSGAYKTLWGKHALLKAYIDKNNLIERETFEREGLKSVAKNEANTDEKAIAGFLQYMYILELTKEHDELKKLIDVDNNTSGDNSEAEAKIAQIENAKANFRFYDKKLIDFMKNESIISSFYIQEEATNLFGENFFSFRANKNLQSFIREYISNWQLMNMIKTRTGLTEDNFANRFKNALSLYVFTNALKPYNPKVDHYKGKRLTDLVNPGSYIKSIDQLRDDFKNKLFLPTNKTETGYLARGLYPIPDNRLLNYSEDDFIELSLEREYLRKYVMPYTDILLMSSEFKYDKRRLLKDMPSLLSTMSDEKINKLVYENMLLNKALLNTYNNYQMFSSDQNTVARKLLQIVNTYGKDLNPVYGDLLERFEFPTTEAKDNQGKRINFKLKSNTTLSKEEQTHFNKLWKELADPSVHKLTDTSEVGMAANKYISDFFSQLSLFAFLQSGMDSSKFNMNNVIPTDKYKPIMDEAAKEFTEKVLRNTLKSEKFLKGFLNMFLAINDISLNGGTYDMKGKGLSYKGNINSIIKSGAELLGEPLEKSDVELNRRVTEISRELASEEPATVQAKLLSDDDVSRFRAELEKSAGKLPTVFYASNRDYRIFYNDQTGIVQGNPEENMWVLNEKSLYDLLDPETGEVYLKDVDLQTGYQSIPENQLNERNEILKDGGRDFNPGPVIIPFISTTAPTFTQSQTPVSTDKVLEGDIFALPGIPVITTNLGGVHGAGLAQAAKAKGLVKQGEGNFKATDDVVQLPVKKKWSDNMSMNNNMELLKESLRSLIKVSKENPTKTYLLPLAGLGHGEGSIEDILPLLIKTVQSSPNIKLVIPAESVNLGRQGTVRKDYTRENLPKIKAMLSEAGLSTTQPQASTKAIQTIDQIYASLPSKTQSENVILPKDLDENKTYTGKNFWDKIVPEARNLYNNKIDRKTGKTKSLLIAYRGNKNKTFLQNYKDGNTVGNPFDFADEKGTRDEQGITSTKKFLEWMITGNNFGNTKATEDYRQAIINDIKSGKIVKSPILYYEEKGYATHATALDYLINKHDWSKPQASTTDKFSKKNIFTVTPQQGVVDNKAVIKASIATQYIGFGEDIVGKDGKRSTTQIYREQAGKYANTGNYSASDVIFVSVPGLRGDATIAKREQDKTINEAIKAVEAGATILTDNKAYTDASSYNTGEKRLYKNMEAKGYNYSEIIVDGQVIGTWSKTQPQAGAGNFEQLYNAEERTTILAALREKYKDVYKDLSDVQLVQRINNRLMTQDRDKTIELLNKCYK